MAITTIKPTGTVFEYHSVNVSGAATEWQACGDNSNDSYMQGDMDKQYIRFHMQDVTLTATQRVRSCQLKIKTARDVAGGTTQDTLAQLVDNRNTTRTPPPGLKTTRGTTAITWGSGPISYSGPGGQTWGQDLVNAIGLSVQWFQVHVGTKDVYQRVYEAWIDVDIVEQPTVTGVGVSNYSESALPHVTWIFDQAEGASQVKWRVKIFDAATHDASNFNAETSWAIFDSGEQDGNADICDTGDFFTLNRAFPATQRGINPWTGEAIRPTQSTFNFLRDGITYYAYVKAAMDWPCPNGPVWWSNWYASSSFTVTFTKPYTPSMTQPSVVSSNNAYRAQLYLDVPLNLLTFDNSSFEGGIVSWVGQTPTAPVLTRDGTYYASGLYSMRMASSGAGDMVARCDFDIIGNPHVESGRQYTVIANFRAGASTRSCSVGAIWLNMAGAAIATGWGSDVTDSAANFNTQATYTATAPDGAVQAKPLVRVKSTGGASEYHYVDKVSMHQGNGTGWTPGGYWNDQGDLFVERGEHVDDERGPAINLAHPDVATGGSVRRTHGYGFVWDLSHAQATWEWLDRALDGQNNPAGYVRWYPDASTAKFTCGWWFYPGAEDYAFPASALRTYTFSVWMWTTVGTFASQLSIEWLDASSSVISTTDGDAISITTTPTRFVITATAALNTCHARVTIANTNSDNGHKICITKIGWGNTSVPVDTYRAMGGPLTWYPIRFQGYQSLPGFPPGIATGQREKFSDYEYPPGRPVLYRASIAYSFSGQVLTSDYSAWQTCYGDPPSVTILRSTTDPTLAVAVNRRKRVSYAYKDDAVVFHPLGADAAPIRVRDWVGGEDGTLIALVSGEAQAMRLRALLSSNDVMEIQWAQGGRTYVIITERTTEETISSDRTYCDVDGITTNWFRYDVVSLDYIETVTP